MRIDPLIKIDPLILSAIIYIAVVGSFTIGLFLGLAFGWAIC